MEKLRPRLLRTYAGQRRGLGGGWRLREAPAPWISPPVDPKRFFSTSSSGGASSCSSRARSSDRDLDFLPPQNRKKKKQQQQPKKKKRQPPRKAKKGAKENQAPQAAAAAATCKAGGSSGTIPAFALPLLLCSNITQRQRKLREPPLQVLGLWDQSPLVHSTPRLLCSTPAKGLFVEEEESLLQGGGGGCRASCSCPRHSCGQQEVLRENSHALPNEVSGWSLLKMDGDVDGQESRGSLELFSQEEGGGLPLESPPQSPPTLVPYWQSGLPLCTPFQSGLVLRPHNTWSKTEASSGNCKGRATSPGKVASSPNPLHDRGCDQKLPALPGSDAVSSRTSQGAFRLQASMCDGKIALSLPKGAAPLAAKRQRVSAQVGATTEKAAQHLNRALLEESSDSGIDQNRPQLRPVVVLDNQVVPNWLASQSSKKTAAGHLSQKKEYSPPSGSSCVLTGICNTRCNSQVVPTCSAGGTSRKACISGFSSSRWGQRGQRGQGGHKKKLDWKAGRLQCYENKEDLALSFLSPRCSSLKNAALWRRMRASFSLHKKKKIRSECESFSNSVLSASSFPSPAAETPQTPFTQKLGYSICPTSSMVMLSCMTSFSTSEVVLTDAEKVYAECQQRGPISFEECIPPAEMQKCNKVGEGVFGEVFKTESEKGTVALKIIPIEGSEIVNGEVQKTFSEILPEIIISKELSLLADQKTNQTSGFISLYSVHCVQGAYPKHLLKAWDDYHQQKESENDRPDFFGDQQLFMVLEFEFGGIDLENMRSQQLNSVLAAKSILHQVTTALAVAEEALHFEHRDLHWGNVLVKKTNLKEVTFTLRGETHTLSTRGVLVNIIDYTFSRLEKDGLTVYCDLSTDEEVFQGRGDYQFDIYRQMREENSNSWAEYYPHSNVLWLHYLADKLLKEVSYKSKSKTTSTRQALSQLKQFSNEVLSFQSATDLLNASAFFH